MAGWIFLIFAILLVGALLFPTIDERKPHELFAARTQINNVVVALRLYRVEYGESLTGENAYLTRTLHGQNLRGIVFLASKKESINRSGEMIDFWGTPLRFDISDPKNPRVWSCGKDRRDDGGAEGSDDITSWR